MTDEQAAVIDFLARPETHGGEHVDKIETHASVVFLAGERALKLKRAVRYDYLDFSTVDRRKAMCEAELRINRRAAPELYRRVIPVTRNADGALSLDGPGTTVDWVLEMGRFDQRGLLDRLAERRELNVDLMGALALAIAQFHETAEPRRDQGGAAGMSWVVEGNASGFVEQGAGVLDPALCDEVTGGARRELERWASLLDARRDAGHVRQCHGDLHLRNIVLIQERPTLFDAVEFNDQISCIDVLYDLAFLVMDLWRRELPRHANAVWNAYLTRTGDLEGLPLMPLFLSCRAAVRAKTNATAARLQQDTGRRRQTEDVSRRYLEMAARLLRPQPPRLVAVGGLSGSGKSVLAQAVAPGVGAVPGAVVIRSDEIRKQLLGVERLERLGPEGYTDEVSRRVYATMSERAMAIVRAGHAAIADAVFVRPADRQAIEGAAAAVGVPFTGIWLDAPKAVLEARVAQRRGDPSDADADVVRSQSTQDHGVMTWTTLDASHQLDAVVDEAKAILRLDAGRS